MAFIQRSHIVTVADRGDASCANTSNAVYALCRGLKYYVSAKNGYTFNSFTIMEINVTTV